MVCCAPPIIIHLRTSTILSSCCLWCSHHILRVLSMLNPLILLIPLWILSAQLGILALVLPQNKVYKIIVSHHEVYKVPLPQNEVSKMVLPQNKALTLSEVLDM